ncbi:MAG TPA: M2 family metallopeptidase [Rhodothermales bacterium]
MRFAFHTRQFVLPFAALLLGACATSESAVAPQPVSTANQPAAVSPGGAPTVAEAQAFVDSVNAVLTELGIKAERAAWVQVTFITHDTEILAAEAYEEFLNAAVGFATEAARFDDLDLPPDLRRQLDLLKRGLSMPAPPDPAKTQELTRISASLQSQYGSGEFCPNEGECMDLGELEEVINYSRDPDSLLMAWEGWRTVSQPMRAEYVRFVELMNEGARELGYSDTGELWRSNYDMEAGAFAAEMDRLYEQVRPLYESLHCYVRDRLADTYGEDLVPRDGPIPAHVLGNMWAQDWSNIYPLVAPEDADPGYDLTQILTQKETSAIEMTRYGERFFSSLGFDPLPETFWERSQFVQPVDHEAVCHASAWDIDQVNDLRIKMCIDPTAEDFQTIHHELGHNYYQRAYKDQPFLYRNSANDGFHEALGDAIALSVTPPYLKQVGLIDEVPPASKDIGLLLNKALDKVAFLPFGLMIDKWRWEVFSGEIGPDEYNAGWWRLREQYQGVKAPVARTEEHFDPGAKYHIPGNTPYARYFLADILQFQFHRSLCEVAGFDGPLHRCSIYGSEEAGERLNAMMELGMSRPWPEALAQLTGGSGQMDATAILDYFAPLKEWLDQQNAGRSCGW